MVDDMAEIAHLNDICDRLGMDTITAGNLCGLAMEARCSTIITGCVVGIIAVYHHSLRFIQKEER